MMRKIISVCVVMMVAGAGLVFAGGAAEEAPDAAFPEELTVISHRVHQSVSRDGDGGDIVGEWLDETGVRSVEWITLGIPEMHDRLFREAELPSGNIDVAFVLNTQLSPEVFRLFEPLDDHMADNPIEELDDIFPGLREATQFDGRQYGVPFRHATSAMHYNEAILRDRGFDGPPETIEEFIEMIPELTYVRDDGTQVYGFLIPGMGQLHANHVDLARAWDGDFITTDYEVVADQQGMINAIQTMRDLMDGGLLPSAWPSIANTDLNQWVQQGRVAMTFSSIGRHAFYNDPEESRHPGDIKTIPIPPSETIRDRFPDGAPGKTEFWTMMIPRNSQNKEAAWDFVRNLSTRENTIRAAISGNGPVRSSTYDDESFQEQVPWWEAEQQILQTARIPLPGFDGSARAADLFTEYAQRAILGDMNVEEAMQRLTEEVRTLLDG